jgi:hypothetical protein
MGRVTEAVPGGTGEFAQTGKVRNAVTIRVKAFIGFPRSFLSVEKRFCRRGF